MHHSALLVLSMMWNQAAAPADARPNVAVLFAEHPEDVSQSLVQTFDDALAGELRASAAFANVVTQKDVETLLGLEKMRQFAACDGNSCVAEIAGALGARYVVTSRVARLDSSLVISVRILDSTAVSLAASRQVLTPATGERLLDDVPVMVRALLADAGIHAGTAAAAGSSAKPALAPAGTPQTETPSKLPMALAVAGGAGIPVGILLAAVVGFNEYLVIGVGVGFLVPSMPARTADLVGGLSGIALGAVWLMVSVGASALLMAGAAGKWWLG